MIRNLGYPTRITFQQFYERYECLGPNPTLSYSNMPKTADWKQLSSSIISAFLNENYTDQILIGKTKVFIKTAAEASLEYLRSKKLMISTVAAKYIQGWFRARKKYWDFRKVVYNIPRIQAA